MKKESKIYIAGHDGLVGSAIVRALKSQGYNNLILRSHKELDLTNQSKVKSFFKKEKPEYVLLAAAKVGGIVANSKKPADFILENIEIQNNVIKNSHETGVKKLLFLGSSCIYPKLCPQPMKEEYLLTGPFEKTSEPFSVAKIAGIIMCQSYNRQYGTNFISAVPANLYGTNDKFDLENSHVLPALIRKFEEAKTLGKNEVILWGTGSPKREFLYVDDLALASIFLMNKYDKTEIINIGTGSDVSIKKLAEMVRGIVGFRGKIIWDKSKPNGTPRKLLNVAKIHKLGWHHKTNLLQGLKDTYKWYVRR